MNMTARKTAMFSLFIGFDAFLLDRLHKYGQIHIGGWTGGERIQITEFFNYLLVWNTGISFGLLRGLPQPLIFALIGVAFALLVWWWSRETGFLIRTGLALVLGGALSNATDRWLYGAVADFFHPHFGNWSFFVFNIADMAITLGAGMLVLDAVRSRKERNV